MTDVLDLSLDELIKAEKSKKQKGGRGSGPKGGRDGGKLAGGRGGKGVQVVRKAEG